MANKIIHKHSNVVNDSKPKLPTKDQLEYGEIAINYAKGNETISLKNSSDEIIEFKSKDYVDEQINSNNERIQAVEDLIALVNETIEDNELVTATAITDLEERTTNVEKGLTNKSDIGHTHVSSAITDTISSITDITETATGLVQGKAVYNYATPKSHASSSTTYGVATTSNYGHVKISNGDVATVASTNGLAAGMNHSHSNYLDKFLTNILYSDLVSLKNESKLIPGMQYRITDYVTTCAEHGNHYTQVNTYSANHNFDIIVVADTVNTINENARAVQHEGDTYFANCNLSAWELKYTLDNNPEIFRWANTENGKGVIYYMKDENNNECMYDFKNIQYDIPSMSILGTHWIFDISKYDTYSIGFEPNKKYYTFSYVSDSGEILDGSIVKIGKSISIAMDNKIGIANPWEYINDLPVIVLLSLPTTHEIMKKYNITDRNINSTNIEKYCEFLFLLAPMERNYFGQCNRYNIIGPTIFQNTFGDYMLGNFMGYKIISNFIENSFQENNIGDNFEKNYLGSNTKNNVFGSVCWYNKIGNYFMQNNIGNNFQTNNIGNYVIENTIGNNCPGNKIGNYFMQNNIGNNFQLNNIGNYVSENTIGDECAANSIGNYFMQNNIGNNFQTNNIGNYVSENTIGDDWWGNIIDNDVYNNIFGSAYNGNNFGNYFHDNKFVMNNNSDAEILNNVSYCIFNNNITYNVFYPDVENFTQEDSLINLHVHNSIHGSEEEYNYIGIPYINNDYEININKNSNNELKMYCEADLIA